MRREANEEITFDAFVDNSSFDVSEGNSIIHTTSHTVCGRPTIKLWIVLGTSRSSNFTRDRFTSDPLRVEKYQEKPAQVNTTVYLDVIENPVEYQKLL